MSTLDFSHFLLENAGARIFFTTTPVVRTNFSAVCNNEHPVNLLLPIKNVVLFG